MSNESIGLFTVSLWDYQAPFELALERSRLWVWHASQLSGDPVQIEVQPLEPESDHLLYAGAWSETRGRGMPSCK